MAGELEELGRIADMDVLVVGAGFAGMWAALRAKELGAKVLLVEKGKAGRSGCSTLASGVQFCPQQGDDLNLWKQEIVEKGEYFPDQDWVDLFLENQMERIKDYERWGAPFERDEKGKIQRVVGRGHVSTRLFMFHGKKLMETLRDQVINRGVEILDRVMITDLLTSDGRHPTKGRVVGAVGINTRSGEFHIFRAKSIILAAGGSSTLKGGGVGTVTGDGPMMAYRAGAELANMEFCFSGNISCWERKGYAGGINMFQGHGAKIVNALGERFLGKYDPVLNERALLYLLCMAYTKEVLEGRGPIYVDMRHLLPEDFEKFWRVIPRPMKLFKGLGVDPKKQLLENSPAMGGASETNGAGGIRIDIKARSALPGLFVAGASARNPIQGIYALGGIATASCNVMGYIAGQNAAKEAKEIGEIQLDADQVRQLKDIVYSPSRVSRGVSADDLHYKLLENTVPAKYSMFKHGDRIRKTLSVIEGIKGELTDLMAPDSHELVKANEMRNMILFAELAFRAALEREESRQYHYREEFPYTDNINWLKLIVFKREDGRMIIRYEPIPVERWSIRPERAKISHPIQIFIHG